MHEDFQELLKIYKGNTAAVDVMRIFIHVAHVWDDLIDEGTASHGEINLAFWNCLIELNSNPFFRMHSQRLTACMRLGILNWLAANELEKTKGVPREIAHVARVAVADIAMDMAEIIGGFQWAQAHAAQIKLMSLKEPFAVYDAEMEARYGNAD